MSMLRGRQPHRANPTAAGAHGIFFSVCGREAAVRVLRTACVRATHRGYKGVARTDVAPRRTGVARGVAPRSHRLALDDPLIRPRAFAVGLSANLLGLE